MNAIEFARNLFSLRMERRMTIEDLADALGVPPETVCEWECAKTSPSLDNMNKLAKLYGIPLDEIIRNPKPHDNIPVPPPAPAEEPEEMPSEEEPLPEPEKPASPRRAAKKKRPEAWELATIILLLAIIAMALFYLFNPERFPISNLKGSWTIALSALKQNLLI